MYFFKNMFLVLTWVRGESLSTLAKENQQVTKVTVKDFIWKHWAACYLFFTRPYFFFPHWLAHLPSSKTKNKQKKCKHKNIDALKGGVKSLK